jgi:hypothetical protein
MSMREAKQRRANVDVGDLTAGRESWSARLPPFRKTFMAVCKAEEMPKK